ncbi:hypothetical protein QA601_00615 [Chitinispirillales bacterium ANBcel5]|uniref:hypothetical protein n=1 Tax=Cellulosispirillum alkaliphilum TaxID=3039283 RepID=UPI002A4EC6F0|nr:hypothetical protein [Chitinispirillales bacterium ANBcel5]
MKNSQNHIVYRSERFSHLYNTSTGKDLWSFLSSPQQIKRMQSEVNTGNAPIKALLTELETRFLTFFTAGDNESGEVAVFINNMLKQLFEHLGYTHTGCARCNGKFIKSTGIFTSN